MGLREQDPPRRRPPVVDSHCDTILEWVNRGRDLGQRSDSGQVDLPRLREGGVGAQYFACYIEPQYKPDRGFARAVELIDAVWRLAAAHPDRLEVALSRADVERIAAAGKVAAVITVEGGEAAGVGTEAQVLACLRALHRLGARSLTLTWNQRNLLADGADEDRTGGGLTNLGVSVVKEMNRLGMLVDVAHISPAGFWQVLEVSEQPVFSSHSNARRLCDHRRNLRDDQIRALAAGGGLVGITFVPAFLAPEPEEASLDHVVAHIEHVAGLVGTAHVAIGSDFDGMERGPKGLDDVSKLPALAEALLRRNFAESDVESIMGGNHLRLLEAVVG